MKRKIALIILACLLIAAGIATVVITDAPVIREQVTVSGGKAEPAMSEYEFNADTDGSYTFEIDWALDEPGLLSGINIVDEEGKSVFACTGDWAQIESNELELESGSYTLETHYLASRSDAEKFLELTGMEDYEVDYEFASDGTWNMKYSFYLSEEGGLSPFYTSGVVVGVLVGLALVMLVFAFTKTDNSAKCRFDERQEVVRGRGFKYGFFTTLIIGGATVIFDMLEFALFSELGVAMMISLLCGIAVFASYCIWNDGYFALNERRRSLMSVFAVTGVCNILIGIANAMHGELMVDGALTVQCINLACGLLFTVIFAVMLAKKIKDGKDE